MKTYLYVLVVAAFFALVATAPVAGIGIIWWGLNDFTVLVAKIALSALVVLLATVKVVEFIEA